MDLVPSDKSRGQPVIWQEYQNIVNAAEQKEVSWEAYSRKTGLFESVKTS